MRRDYPILEFDATPEAIIEPRHHIEPLDGIPKHGVICFFQEVIDHLLKEGTLQEITALASEMGRHPVYEFESDSGSVILFHPGVGAPLAAGLFEEVIALGCSKFIVCGSSGVLDSDIAMGHLLADIEQIFFLEN